MNQFIGLPLFGTLPHFLKAEQLLDGVASGLNPNKEDHQLYCHLEIVCLEIIQCFIKLEVDSQIILAFLITF